MSELEHRYRRLIAWYPRDFRAAHEEEMLGVLLATAASGRSRPNPRDAIDLIRGAVRIRLRHAFGPESAPHWRDALNVSALVAVFMCLIPMLGTGLLKAGLANDMPVSARLLWLASPLPCVLILTLAWRDLRWPAAACAWAWTVVQIGMFVNLVGGLTTDTTDYAWSSFNVIAMTVSFLPFFLSALLLTVAPNPGSGVEIVGRRRLLRWSSLTTLALMVPWIIGAGGSPDYLELLQLALLALACGLSARSPVGCRSLLLLAAVALPQFGYTLISRTLSGEWLIPAIELIALSAIALIIARSVRAVPALPISSSWSDSHASNRPGFRGDLSG